MSYCKPVYDTLDICEQQSKSSSKRLFQSVFKILDDQFEVSSFEQTDTNGSKINKLLQNQMFIQAVFDKLKEQVKQTLTQQLDQLYPILKVQCKSKNGVLSIMDLQDLTFVFNKFGNLYTTAQLQSQQTFYIFFTSFASAYVAMKLMHNFPIRHSLSNLSVEWCHPEQYSNVSHIIPEYYLKVEWNVQEGLTRKNSNTSSNQNSKQCKLTCRYDIQIENQKDFQVARRIIGSKGTNMKKIIQSSLEQIGQKNSNLSNQMLKLRLRGRGSGYKEGPQQLQSEEQLHLCISAKDQTVYDYACQSVEKLLQNVYSQYQQYTKKQGKCICLVIRKSDIAQPSLNANNQNVMKNIQVSKNGRMEPEKIEQFLQLRNKARRELNFAEADRIRNYLRACGVCLIDQKGRRGKATEVTAWKYVA